MPASTIRKKTNIITLLATSAILFAITAPAVARIDPMTKSFPEPSMKKFKKHFPRTFKVSSPSVKNHMLGLKYACPMRGKNVSPAISWSGIPSGTTRLHLTIEDGFCTWGCDRRGKADHWILDFPINIYKRAKYSKLFTKTGITENAASSKLMKRYTKHNAMGKRGYLGMCSPKGQPHAWVIQLTAYKIKHGRRVVNGKTQSIPFLFPRSELK